MVKFLKLVSSAESDDLAPKHPIKVIPDDRIDAFFVSPGLPPDVLLLGRFWRHVTTDAVTDLDVAPVQAAAEATPPMPWANRLLGRWNERMNKHHDAALYFEREGTEVEGHDADVEHALLLFIADDDWGAVVGSPKIRNTRSTSRFASATRSRSTSATGCEWCGGSCRINTRGSRRAFSRSRPPQRSRGSGSAHASGQITERAKLRVPLYVVAFLLGIVSIYVTLAILEVENHFGFRENGNPLGDLIYYVLGVGLREEFSKIVCFLPLLPLIRRARGGKREVWRAARSSGLGFASEENVNYFSGGSLSVAITRF